MNWKWHLVIGTVAGCSFALAMNRFFAWYQNDVLSVLIIFLVAAISSLVPDLDHENGMLHNIIIGTGLSFALAGMGLHFLSLDAVAWTTIIFGIFVASAAFFGAKIAHHRGFVHSITFCLLYACLVFFVLSSLPLAGVAFVGAYSHLAADKLPLKLM